MNPNCAWPTRPLFQECLGCYDAHAGLATFLATVSDVGSGASLGVAIAIHNVPEGLCVAMPIYYATGHKWKAFGLSVLSGITETIGKAHPHDCNVMLGEHMGRVIAVLSVFSVQA